MNAIDEGFVVGVMLEPEGVEVRRPRRRCGAAGKDVDDLGRVGRGAPALVDGGGQCGRRGEVEREGGRTGRG